MGMVIFKNPKVIGVLIIILVCIGLYGMHKKHAYDAYRFEALYWSPKFQGTLNRDPKYLPRDYAFDIPNPPKNSSWETKSELKYLKSLEAQRDEKTKELILFEADPTVTTIQMMERSGIIDPAILQQAPVMKMLTEAYFSECWFFEIREKKRFERPRPSHLDPSLNLFIDNPSHPAYPSGHSTEAHMIAYLLAPLFPEKMDALIAYADGIAKRREIAGVHYPSDSAAGAELGRQLAQALMKDENYQKVYTEAWIAVQNYRVLENEKRL